MEKTLYRSTNTLGDLTVQLGDETKKDFTCHLYDDGVAEVPGPGFRLRRIPDDIVAEHGIKEPTGSGELFLITQFFNDVDRTTFLGAISGRYEFPVHVDEETVTAIKTEMDKRYINSLADVLARDPKISEPATGYRWTAYSLDQVPGMKEDGRAAYVAHDEEDQYIAFDVLEDGSTEVMAMPGSGIAEILFEEIQADA
ncbi:hypothetical protein [Roseovarius sp. SYSU LYC5161]|jgi:hypothetical protein|uniref:hypothetical protein n=1 Tax=Roseovarius halophilus (ex Wu et al. 2025) TaxID=3376060 RepID=UPI00399A157E